MNMYEFGIKFSLKFVPTCQINNIAALVQIMACRLPGDKPLSETMVISLLTHICVTRPHWVNVQMCFALIWYSQERSAYFSFAIDVQWSSETIILPLSQKRSRLKPLHQIYGLLWQPMDEFIGK